MRRLIINEQQFNTLREAQIIQMPPAQSTEDVSSPENWTVEQRAAYLYPPDLLKQGYLKQYAIVSLKNQFEVPQYFWKKSVAMREKQQCQHLTASRYALVDLKKIGIPLGLPKKEKATENGSEMSQEEPHMVAMYYKPSSEEARDIISQALTKEDLPPVLKTLGLILVGKEPMEKYNEIPSEEISKASNYLSQWGLEIADAVEANAQKIRQKVEAEYGNQEWNLRDLLAEVRHRMNQRVFNSIPYVFSGELTHLRQQIEINSQQGKDERIIRINQLILNNIERGKGENVINILQDYDWDLIFNKKRQFLSFYVKNLPLIYDACQRYMIYHSDLFDNSHLLPWQEAKKERFLNGFENLKQALREVGYDV